MNLRDPVAFCQEVVRLTEERLHVLRTKEEEKVQLDGQKKATLAKNEEKVAEAAHLQAQIEQLQKELSVDQRPHQGSRHALAGDGARAMLVHGACPL